MEFLIVKNCCHFFVLLAHSMFIVGFSDFIVNPQSSCASQPTIESIKNKVDRRQYRIIKKMNIRSTPTAQGDENKIGTLSPGDTIEGVQLKEIGWIKIKDGYILDLEDYVKELPVTAQVSSSFAATPSDTIALKGTSQSPLNTLYFLGMLISIGIWLSTFNEKSKELDKKEVIKEEPKTVCILIPVLFIENHKWLFFSEYTIEVGYFFEIFHDGIPIKTTETRYFHTRKDTKINQQELISLVEKMIEAIISTTVKNTLEATIESLAPHVKSLLPSAANIPVQIMDVQYQEISEK
jgi:hypothetical protein